MIHIAKEVIHSLVLDLDHPVLPLLGSVARVQGQFEQEVGEDGSGGELNGRGCTLERGSVHSPSR